MLRKLCGNYKSYNLQVLRYIENFQLALIQHRLRGIRGRELAATPCARLQRDAIKQRRQRSLDIARAGAGGEFPR